jgi:ribosome maturation factor RimP
MAAAGTPSARISALLEPLVLAAGFDLEDVEVSPARGNRQAEVRVLVDKIDGIDLDDVALVSRLISAALDADVETDRALGEGMYVLEVSSPGVDRPLREPRHWRRNVGRLVAVAVSGKESTGRVIEVDDAGVKIEVAGVKGRPGKVVVATFGELGPGRVQVEFTHHGAPDDLDDVDDDSDDLDDLDGEFDGDENDSNAQEEAR